jgi:hypothetical protein
MAELTNEGIITPEGTGPLDFISQELFLAEAFLFIGLFVVIRSQKRGIFDFIVSQKGYSYTFGVVSLVLVLNNIGFGYESFFKTNEFEFSSIGWLWLDNGVEWTMVLVMLFFGRVIPRLFFGSLNETDYGPALTNVILWSSFLIVAYGWPLLLSLLSMGNFVPGDWIMTYYSTIDWLSVFIFLPLALTFFLPNSYD